MDSVIVRVAAGGRHISLKSGEAKGARSLTWRFEEKEAADFMRSYLHKHNPDINVEWWPMPSDQQ